MEQGEHNLKEALAGLLLEDRQILGRRDELLEKLAEKAEGADPRFMNALKTAFKLDIGELLLSVDQSSEEEQEKAKAEAIERLRAGNMQEKRISSVMDIVVGALRWGDEEEAVQEELLEAPAEEQPAEEQPPLTWDCHCGKTGNKGKFCVACGKTKEQSEAAARNETEKAAAGWSCLHCGRQGNTGKFCAGCGKPKEQSDGAARNETENGAVGWSCPHCGRQGNTGKFCAGCGKPRAEGRPAEPQPASRPISLDKTETIGSVQDVFAKAKTETAPAKVAPAMAPSPQPTFQPQPAAASSGGNGAQTAIIAVIAVLVCALGFMGYKEISASNDATASSGYHSVAKESDKPKENHQPVAKSELSLGGVDLDDSLDELRKKLGWESKTEAGKEGITFYYFDGNLHAGVRDGIVGALVSDSDKCSTKRGIHQGSSLQEVLNAYGNDFMKSSYDNLELYEYNFKSLSGREGILRFAINGNGAVDYISVRIPQEPKVDTQAVGNAAKNAVASYHKYITNKDYRAAYNLLTPDMQNTMGLYENWAQGFRNTIESRATDLQVASVQADQAEVTFVLVARDRRPGGGYEENRFRSTVTVVNVGGSWKIAAVNNKKI